MKKFLSLFLLCTLFIVGCSKTDSAEYKTDVTIDDLSSKMLSPLDSESYIEAEESWIALNVDIDPENWEDSTIYISANGKADMIGVFKGSSEEAAQNIYEEAEQYLKTLEENWMSEYLPEELPKIQNAICQKSGLYVTFIILDDELRDSVLTEFDNALKN